MCKNIDVIDIVKSLLLFKTVKNLSLDTKIFEL